MAYKFTNSKGSTYILHANQRTTKSGAIQTLYFFSKTEKPGALDAVPTGYMVVESANGLPVLKKKQG
jgi:hypothetical protein